MAAKSLIVVIDERSGRILAARIVSARRAQYEFEQLTDYFQLGASEETVPLATISETLAIRLKRVRPDPKIRADHQLTLPFFSSPQLLP